MIRLGLYVGLGFRDLYGRFTETANASAAESCNCTSIGCEATFRNPQQLPQKQATVSAAAVGSSNLTMISNNRTRTN